MHFLNKNGSFCRCCVFCSTVQTNLISKDLQGISSSRMPDTSVANCLDISDFSTADHTSVPYNHFNCLDIPSHVHFTETINQTVMGIMDIFSNCIMVTSICAFGIFGNIINIVVLGHHGFKESTNIALMSLSVSDLLFCLMLPMTKLACIIQHFDEALAVTFNTFGNVYFFMSKYVAVANAFLLLTFIALERFTAVFFPFQVAKIFARHVMKKLVIFSAVFSLATLIPTFTGFNYEWQFDHRFNKTVAIMRPTQFYNSHKIILDLYMWVVLNNVFCTFTMVVISVCCLAIGLKLTRAAVKREKMTSKATGYDIKVVKMLVTVCVVYLCVQSPTIVVHQYYHPDFVSMIPQAKIAVDICIVLYSVNASVNFIIYVTMSDKFAHTYRRLLGCQKLNKTGPSIKRKM